MNIPEISTTRSLPFANAVAKWQTGISLHKLNRKNEKMCYFAVGVLSHPVDICIYNNVACTEHFHKKYRRIGI